LFIKNTYPTADSSDQIIRPEFLPDDCLDQAIISRSLLAIAFFRDPKQSWSGYLVGAALIPVKKAF
jgi:hypothetical protein